MDSKKAIVLSVLADLMIVALLVFDMMCLNQTSGKINEANNRVAAVEQQNDELKDEINSMTDALEVYESENASLNDALKEIKDELGEQQDIIDELHKQEEDTTEDKEESTESKNDTTGVLVGSVSDIETDNDSMVFSATRDEGITSPDVIKDDSEPMAVYEEEVPEPTYLRELSENDRYYLERMVETETYGADMMSKTHVASVALNRLDAGNWGSSVQAIITAKNQFAYFRTSISDSTREAVDYVLMYGDTAQGALYFHSGGYTSTFCGRPCIFGDDVGHYFY